MTGDWPLSEQAATIAADRNIPLTVQFNSAVGLGLFRQYIDDSPDLTDMEKQYLMFCRKMVYHVHFAK